MARKGKGSPFSGLGAPNTGTEFGMFGMGTGQFNEAGNAKFGDFMPDQHYGMFNKRMTGPGDKQSPQASPGLG